MSPHQLFLFPIINPYPKGLINFIKDHLKIKLIIIIKQSKVL